ncbi:MAG: sulfur globule protein precursor [Phyllobacteriaceae bacterium]|nr:sulfur globule protein precursor [Phyllobacteriaceae bacterium]
MSTLLRNSLLAVVTAASLLGAAAATPAAAHDWWGRGGGWGDGYRRDWRDEDRGWGHRRDWGRPHCWIETRRVREFTPWGPRGRLVEESVCR